MIENKPKKHICFVTSLFSKFSDYVDKPGYFNRIDKLEKDENDTEYNKLTCDYLLFTNLNVEDFNTSWDIIKIPFDGKKFRNFVVLSRYPKFMLWKIMEDYKKYFEFSYDIVVYCDAFLSPNHKYDWSKIYNFIINKRSLEIDNVNKVNKLKNIDQLSFIQSQHHYKKIREGGIVEDAKMIISSNKDSFIRIGKTLKFFKSQGYGGVWLKRNGYVENTVFCYDLLCLKTRKFLQDFWDLYKISEFTYRDQILWNYLLIKQKKKIIVFDKLDLNNKDLDKDLNKDLDKDKNYDNIEYRKTMKDLIFVETGEIIGHNKDYYS